MLKVAKRAFGRTLRMFTGDNSISPVSILKLTVDPLIVTNNEETGRLKPDAAPDLIVQNAQQVTNASGAVVALLRGQRIVSVARAGALVPGVDIPVDTDAGLTGACIRAGEPLCCNDSTTDPRVNGGVCLRFGIRSVVVVPIRNNCHEIVGILEAVSNEANAFDHTHIDSLKVLARRCSAYAEQTVENGQSAIECAAKEPKIRTANYQDPNLQFCEMPSPNSYVREDSLHTTQNRRRVEPINATNVEHLIDRISHCRSWDDVCRQIDGDQHAFAATNSSD
jgi:putative methionine-R-sulfoxide reductase with GAF domain